MADFIRARSDEQKEQRMRDIKRATAGLFEHLPYHEITLTTIAEELGWSRANLYKYVTTKEEIFLEISADKRDAYTNALLTAFPAGCGYAPETSAEVWSGIAAAHREYFHYGNLLYTVIETNVSVERLAEFKRGYFEGAAGLRAQLAPELGVPADRMDDLAYTVYNHGVGLSGSCAYNPLVREALAQIGVEWHERDFRAEMRDFIAMCLDWYRAQG